MQGSTAIVEPAKGERILYPRWMGAKMPLSAQLAREQLAIRRALRFAWDSGGPHGCLELLRDHYHCPADAAARTVRFVERQYRAAPIPIDSPLQIQPGLNRAQPASSFPRRRRASREPFTRLGGGAPARCPRPASRRASMHQGFLITVDPRRAPDSEAICAAFNPAGFRDDLRVCRNHRRWRRFRPVAEIGQLLPRRTLRGETSRKTASWSAPCSIRPCSTYEPDHPLVRECVRGVIEDECDAAGAESEAARLHVTPDRDVRPAPPFPVRTLALRLVQPRNADVRRSRSRLGRTGRVAILRLGEPSRSPRTKCGDAC